MPGPVGVQDACSSQLQYVVDLPTSDCHVQREVTGSEAPGTRIDRRITAMVCKVAAVAKQLDAIMKAL
jgi:hypothetical protein